MNKTIKHCGKKFHVEAFHPKRFEKGAYTVRFHQAGKPHTDAYTHHAMVSAKNATQAISKAKKEMC